MRKTIKLEVTTRRGKQRIVYVDLVSKTADTAENILKRLKSKYRMKVRQV